MVKVRLFKVFCPLFDHNKAAKEDGNCSKKVLLTKCSCEQYAKRMLVNHLYASPFHGPEHGIPKEEALRMAEDYDFAKDSWEEEWSEEYLQKWQEDEKGTGSLVPDWPQQKRKHEDDAEGGKGGKNKRPAPPAKGSGKAKQQRQDLASSSSGGFDQHPIAKMTHQSQQLISMSMGWAAGVRDVSTFLPAEDGDDTEIPVRRSALKGLHDSMVRMKMAADAAAHIAGKAADAFRAESAEIESRAKEFGDYICNMWVACMRSM